jgi:hypothetical protein
VNIVHIEGSLHHQQFDAMALSPEITTLANMNWPVERIQSRNVVRPDRLERHHFTANPGRDPRPGGPWHARPQFGAQTASPDEVVSASRRMLDR